jgi:phage recombination protein Bet
MSNEQTQTKELVVKYDIDGEIIKLTPNMVQEYIVGTNNGKITLPEFKFFSELCKVRKLNPFLKEAYCIKYGNNPAQIVVGKDAILKRAIKHPQYDGMESGIMVQVIDTGEIIERKGTFYIKAQENVVGGWARVYRKDWKYPIYCSVGFDEVAQRKSDGTLNTQWRTKGATMVEKVAKVRALRETFVEELGGMYEAEEMGVQLPNEPNEPAPSEEIIQQGDVIEADAVEVVDAEVVSMEDI